MPYEYRVSFLIGPKGDDYHLIQKVIAVIHESFGNEFSLSDLVSLAQFTRSEKRRLKKIFHHNFTRIYAWDAQFDYLEGRWKYQMSDRDQGSDMRDLLILLNKRKFEPGTIVSTDNLNLIKSLILEQDKLFAMQWAMWRDDAAPRMEINQAVLSYFSNNIKQRIGEHSTFNFNFVKTFQESYYDYCTILIVKAILGTEEPPRYRLISNQSQAEETTSPKLS